MSKITKGRKAISYNGHFQYARSRKPCQAESAGGKAIFARV